MFEFLCLLGISCCDARSESLFLRKTKHAYGKQTLNATSYKQAGAENILFFNIAIATASIY